MYWHIVHKPEKYYLPVSIICKSRGLATIPLHSNKHHSGVHPFETSAHVAQANF